MFIIKCMIKKVLTIALLLALVLSPAQAFAAVADGSGPWADTVISSSQGLRKNGTPVLAARSNPSASLGVAETTGTVSDSNTTQSNFYSLGFGGSVTLGFENAIANEDGNDLQVYEVTGGSYPDETLLVEASHNGTDWVTLSTAAIRDEELDLGILPCAKYVRLTDVSNVALFEAAADGYDLDAVKALHNGSVCEAASSVMVDKTVDDESVFAGTTVNYAYAVTNTGSFDLTNVNLSDDVCSPLTDPTGDDGDGVLESGEVWSYSCSQTLDQTTTNVATVTATDPWQHLVQDTDEVTVTIEVLGCTYTQGYWKNHSLTSNHPDETWSSLANPETWLSILETPVKGNSWYQLAHQYIAAWLNIENGAFASDTVVEAMADAQPLVGSAVPVTVSKAEKSLYVNLAGVLANFNEGLTETPHCGD